MKEETKYVLYRPGMVHTDSGFVISTHNGGLVAYGKLENAKLFSVGEIAAFMFERGNKDLTSGHGFDQLRPLPVSIYEKTMQVREVVHEGIPIIATVEG